MPNELPTDKRSEDATLKTNSCLGFLTSLCKLMEKMVTPCLVWYVVNKCLVSPSQPGYRAGRSTLHSFARMEDYRCSIFRYN